MSVRLTVVENQILNALAETLPANSSVKKLTKALGRAREEIVETLEGLGRLKMLSIANNNEVYLLKEGKAHLGLSPAKDEPKSALAKSSVEQFNEELVPRVAKTIANKRADNLLNAESSGAINPARENESTEQTKRNGLMVSLDKLTKKLGTPVHKVSERELKCEVLERLSIIVSDDIAEVLTDIKADLEKAA